MDDDEPRWLGEARFGGLTYARIGTRGDCLLAEWSRIGVLTVKRDGSNPRFESVPGVDPVQHSKIEKGAMRLLLRSLEGKIGLHGAAVELGGRAIVLLGDSRDGKSTLAAALCVRSGAHFLADDAVALADSPWRVEPTERAHFLDAKAIEALQIEGATSKLRGKASVEPSRVSEGPTPLAAIVRLRFDDRAPAPRLERLGLVDAIARLIPQTIRFALDEPERHRAEADKLCDLVTQTATFELVRAPRIEELNACVNLVRELVLDEIRP